MITSNEAKALVENFKTKEQERLNKEIQKIDETIVVAAKNGITSCFFDCMSAPVRDILVKNGFHVENCYADHAGNDTRWKISWC